MDERRTDAADRRKPLGAIDSDQAWFWTERWQQMEREADEAYAAGRFETFDAVEAFLADLDRSVREDA